MDHSSDYGDGDPTPIYKVIYHSQIAVSGGHERITEHVRQILTWSRKWNPAHGITGALMLNDENFSQVLEGPKHAVKSLFGHIVCDSRHKNVELLQCDTFKKRDFSNWSMAFAGSSTESDISLASHPRFQDPDLCEGANGVMSLLRWLLHEKRITIAIRGGLDHD